jgi:hypothetical protein
MNVKGMKQAGIAGLSLAVLLAGQMLPARAKTTHPKTRSFTGRIVQYDGHGPLVLEGGKKGQKTFMVNEKTKIWTSDAITSADLAQEAMVRVKGKGQHHQITVAKLTVLENHPFKTTKKAKSGDAYGAQAKSTSITGKIVQTSPLTVINRHQQTIELKLTDKTVLVKETKAGLKDLTNKHKAKVLYQEVDGQNLAKKIYL